MMKPESLNILGIEYKIIYVEKPSDVDLQGREALMGQIDYWTRTIRVYDNGRSLNDIWQTLIHEILHAIGSELHLKINEEKFHEELDTIAVVLTDVLFRNGILKFPEIKRGRNNANV